VQIKGAATVVHVGSASERSTEANESDLNQSAGELARTSLVEAGLHRVDSTFSVTSPHSQSSLVLSVSTQFCCPLDTLMNINGSF